MKNEYRVVKNIPLLREMEKAGFVKLHHQTGKRVGLLYSSKTTVATYVYEAKNHFVFLGKTYEEKYFDGCFMPFVVEILNEN
jgi:hypothetical protein